MRLTILAASLALADKQVMRFIRENLNQVITAIAQTPGLNQVLRNTKVQLIAFPVREIADNHQFLLIIPARE